MRIAVIEDRPAALPVAVTIAQDTPRLPEYLLHPDSVKASTLNEPKKWSVRKPFWYSFLAAFMLVGVGIGLQVLLERQYAQAAVIPPANHSSNAAPAVLGASASSQAENYDSVSSSAPQSLDIEPLNIHAKVISADFTENGNLTKSINDQDAAWNKVSAKPGKQGTMIIASNTYSCIAPGIFSSLKDITLGTGIVVTNGAGVAVNYKVIRTQVLEQDKVNLETLSEPPVHYRPGLNIVTCADNNETGKRLVVNAVLYQ